jgi:uncharacterized membrane protein
MVAKPLTVCEVCGRNEALYVCRECGRKICGECLDADFWLCPECLVKVKIAQPPQQPAPSLPSGLLFLGFLLILAGMALIAFSAVASASLQGGKGFFFFFPFPFIFTFGFGAGEFPVGAVFFLAAALVFLAFIAYLFFRTLRLQT